MKDVFDSAVTRELVARVRSLEPSTQPRWGKMSVGQMLAHCCVPYEMVYEDKHPRPGKVARFLLRTFVKRGVVGEKPYRFRSVASRGPSGTTCSTSTSIIT